MVAFFVNLNGSHFQKGLDMIQMNEMGHAEIAVRLASFLMTASRISRFHKQDSPAKQQ